MKLWKKSDEKIICEHSTYKVLCRKCERAEYERIIKDLKKQIKDGVK